MKRALVPLFLVVLVDILAFTLVIPLLAIYAETHGATPFQATALVSTYALGQLVSSPILGKISDVVGRKPVLLVSQLGTLAGLLLLARADSLWVLFVARAIDGLTAGNLSLAHAYIADRTAPEERSSAFAFLGIAFGIGFFVGPSAAGLLAARGLATPIYAAAALSLASVLGTAFLLPRDARRGPAEEGVRSLRIPASIAREGGRVLVVLYAQIFALMFAFSSFVSSFALFAERRFVWAGRAFGAREVGLAFGFMGLVGILSQGVFFRPLARRFGERRLVHVGFCAMVCVALGLTVTHSVGVLVALLVLPPVGDTFVRPTLLSMLTQRALASERGLVIGLAHSLQSLAQILAPLLAGTLLTHGQLAAWALVPAAAAGVGLALARGGSSRPVASAGP